MPVSRRNRLARLITRWDGAGAGGLVVFGVGILFVGLFLGVIGFALDPVIAVNSNYNALIPISQENIDTMHNLLLMFKACAILVPLGFGISYWANSTRQTPGEV